MTALTPEQHKHQQLSGLLAGASKHQQTSESMAPGQRRFLSLMQPSPRICPICRQVPAPGWSHWGCPGQELVWQVVVFCCMGSSLMRPVFAGVFVWGLRPGLP